MNAGYAEVSDELATLEELLTYMHVVVLGENEPITINMIKQVEERRKAQVQLLSNKYWNLIPIIYTLHTGK